MDVVPACWTFVHHALLHAVDTGPCRRIGACEANIFAAIGKGEPFVGDARALVEPVGAGMAEAAVYHVPAMQARATGQGIIPDKWIESSHCPVVIDQSKKLLRQLNLFDCQWGRWAIGSGS